jgi:TetR/AcrR family transcriptional repressor of nem operon
MNAGRPRKYPPEVILEKAMQVFWAQGYEGTSMADIMAATGMHKGSLYQTFGDKKALFMAALSRYLDQLFMDQQAIIRQHQGHPAKALRAALSNMLNMKCDHNDALHGGCMVVNSMVDSAPFDQDIADLLENKQQRMIGAFMQLLNEIHVNNPNQLKGSPEVVGAMIGITMQGLSIEMKNHMGVEQANVMLNHQLDLLGL